MGVFLYTLVWSIVSILKFYAFTTQVYDLGISVDELWQVTNNNWSPLYYAYIFLYEGIRFPLAWLPYVGGDPFVLGFQSAALGCGAVFVYAIARFYRLPESVSLPLALSYLVYFPLGAVNWYDFHFEALFPTLFLAGFFLYLKQRYIPAGVVLCTAALVRYPYMGFILLFVIVLLIEQGYRYFRQQPGLQQAQIRFALVMGGIAIAYFIAFYFVGPAATIGPTYQTHNMGGSPLLGLKFKLDTVLLILVPFALVLPFARRWPVFLVPFFVISFFANYKPYYYPILLVTQYSVLFIPFVYLIAIEGLVRYDLGRKSVEHPPSRPTPLYRWRRRLYRLPPQAPAWVTVAVIASMALVYEPYGPFHTEAGVPWNFGSSISVNWTRYYDYQAVASLIPSRDPYVLFQEDMPTILPRPTPYGDPMVPTIATFGFNYSTNHFPVLDTVNYTWIDARIDYAISNPWDLHYFDEGINATMSDLMSAMYPSGGYGFVAEIDGISLLEAGYTGGMKYYSPFQSTFPIGSVPAGPNATRNSLGQLVGTNPNGTPDELLMKPFVAFLQPGRYQVTFWISSEYLEDGDRITIRDPIGGNWTVTNLNFSSPDELLPVTETILVQAPVTEFTMSTFLDRWYGTVTLDRIQIQQIEPPLPQSG